MADSPKLDRFDRKILELLQTNAGFSNQELAERVGLSASPCSRRIKSLEERGFIDQRITLLNRKAINLNLIAIINIRMDRHTPDRFARFEKAIGEIDEVIECILVTGQDADYQLRIAVPDMDAYHKVLLNKITTIEGVDGVHSSFVLRDIIKSKPLPLTYLP
ncbi:Lrp/AsnC family transcriptional regulator [Reinekea marinisedimentorum]|uniref:Lrp/AsnC family leucine-responsive transcriptional regulator n=1 Tax=Reinekea marinisedimentorum TaxID=230495 RepID=A0A4R3IBN4_9GAMM|nr:Lrp/AsnC family transcriptional regulator [Reinekea marinisedimentorum]TCS43881.1 Lrp/AsnC family leucine-responsive transcriptional regulator [Reinekea marinisedimentorum]